jgi:hypothetical protein
MIGTASPVMIDVVLNNLAPGDDATSRLRFINVNYTLAGHEHPTCMFCNQPNGIGSTNTSWWLPRWPNNVWDHISICNDCISLQGEPWCFDNIATGETSRVIVYDATNLFVRWPMGGGKRKKKTRRKRTKRQKIIISKKRKKTKKK